MLPTDRKALRRRFGLGTVMPNMQIRVKKRGLSARHGGRSLLFSGMPRPRWSMGSIRQPWYQYITMQSGKAHSLYVFEHSQAMTAGLAKLAQAGIKEAAAPKIES
jgi:hypothetical protein